jgi:hypothetical protein
MKPRKIMVLGIIVAVAVLAFIVGQFIQSSIGIAYWGKAIEDAQNRRVLLLCNTDHHALLKAGREILSQVPKDRLNPQPDGIRHVGDIGIPKGVEIPQAILDLKPRGCLVSLDGYLTLEMHGGLDHFGVQIYPEDFMEPEEPGDYFKYGDRELLPGLWYYDEGYHYGPEEYDKRINELIEENTENGNK